VLGAQALSVSCIVRDFFEKLGQLIAWAGAARQARASATTTAACDESIVDWPAQKR
jgi:hypothetical protein